MNAVLTFGREQVHTSQRMRKHPRLARLFQRVFGYTNLGNYARFGIFKKMMAQIELPENAKILDLGAGYGEYSFSLAQALPAIQVHALDINKKRVERLNSAMKASKIQNIQTHHAFLHELEEKEFDFIYSVDVFEHILPEEMPFRAAHERLKSGGLLLVKMPNIRQLTILPEGWFEAHQEWLEDEHIGQVYDLEGLKNRYEQEGFEVLLAFYSDGWWSRLAWELAYLGKKAGLVTQLLTLLVAKLLIQIDRLIHKNHSGNAIQVIGKKK